MKLSDFEICRILTVDSRYEQEKDRLISILKVRGACPGFFIDGQGTILSKDLYTQTTAAEPSTWQDGRAAFNHFRAFKSMIQGAKMCGAESLLIAEDDLVLTENFDEIVNRVKIPSDWDMIYYGANHDGAGTRDVAENVMRCFGSKTTHLVGFRKTIFDDVLSLPADRTIDWNIAHRLHSKYNCYAIWPSVALQKPGLSTLWHCQVDYSYLWSIKGNPV